MARRFIVNKEDIRELSDNKIQISGAEVKHIQVLRHNICDRIHLNDNICEILEIKRDTIILEIIGKAEKFGEPNINLKLYIAFLKGEKMDLVIQKAVELGVKEIVPFFSKNVIVKLDEKDYAKKKEKLQKIADEACKQCGRTDEVRLLDFIKFEQVCNNVKKDNICFFAYENSKEDLKLQFDKIRNDKLDRVSCIIGPEGGFDKSEAQIISNIDSVKNISLGSRILRAETAAIAMCSIIMYELDK